MTATDDRPVNGHKVNGHGHHGYRWAPFAPIPELGPAEPLTQPLPAVPDTGTTAEPSPEPAAEQSETSLRTPAWEPELPPLPELPTEPTFNVDKEYWGHKALVGVYWIAIATGAIGQAIFFGELFNAGIVGYVGAVIGATTAETVMVTACDTALKHRVHGARKRRWLPFLIASFAAAFAASAMNLSHFAPVSVSLGVLLGGVSLLGFLLHVMDGFVKGSDHLDRKREYDEAVKQRQAEQRQRAEAAYERQLAEFESHQQAARRVVEQVETTPAAAAAEQQAKPVKQAKPSKGKAKSGTAPAFTQADAQRELGDELWTLKPAEVNQRMETAGYRRKDPSAIRRWKNQ